MGNCITSAPDNNEESASNKAVTSMTAITRDHSDYNLAISIQNGLYGSLSSKSTFSDLITTSKSIEDECTMKLDYNLNSDIKEEVFTEYAPEIFAKLRKTFNITDDIYLSILTGDNNMLLSFLSNSKSGQYFFFSNNSQFLIKTMNKSELEFLLQILPSYYQYMVNETNSLIPRFYGIYKLNKIKINNSNKDISFLISNNVFYSPQNIEIEAKYDLKGSTQGRKTDEIGKQSGSILKDLNFIEHNIHIQIARDNKAKLFHQQINKDCQWFSKHLIMDYSLLVGIADAHHHDNNHNDNDEIKYDHNDNNIFSHYYGGLLSDDTKKIYFIGIIDILQKYNTKKKMAGFVKGIKYEQYSLSTVPPDMYAKRFCEFFKYRVL